MIGIVGVWLFNPFDTLVAFCNNYEEHPSCITAKETEREDGSGPLLLIPLSRGGRKRQNILYTSLTLPFCRSMQFLLRVFIEKFCSVVILWPF